MSIFYIFPTFSYKKVAVLLPIPLDHMTSRTPLVLSFLARAMTRKSN